MIPGSNPDTPIPFWSQEYDISNKSSKNPSSSSAPSPPIALSTQYPKHTSGKSYFDVFEILYSQNIASLACGLFH